MNILIAEDDRMSNRMLAMLLAKWGHEVVCAGDGAEAWERLRAPNGPQLAILDWMMPGMDGITICQLARQTSELKSHYLILLTTLGRTEDIVTGLESGANDYVVKPFNAAELRARVGVGVRMIQLQNELTASRREVHQLQGILPICAYCKKIRADKNYWQQVESYVAQRSEATFSHGICPECFEKFVKTEIEGMKSPEAPSGGF
jgi:DNA-binding response OmpR family regulator